MSIRLPPDLLRFVDLQAASAFQTRSQYLTALVAKAYQQAQR